MGVYAVKQTMVSDDFLSVTRLDAGKIDNLLRSGCPDTCREEFEQMLDDIHFDQFKSMVLRLYVCTDIYIMARNFANELGISDGRFTSLLGDADSIEEQLSTLEATKKYLIIMIEQCISWRIERARSNKCGVVSNAKKYIESNYMRDDISLESIAHEVGLSPTYFSALFKKETGQCLSNYLNMVRIDKSKQLLCCTSKMIYEIAFEVGFQDYRYFGQIFKKYTGQTPRQFQKVANVRT